MIFRNRKLALVVAVLFFGAAFLSGAILWKYRSGEVHDHAEDEQTIYYCPMHPTVVSDGPGNCPICGMKLIRRAPVLDPAASDLATAGSLDLERLALSPTQRVLANVATVPVRMAPWSDRFTTTGVVDYDETRLAQVTSYTAGRVERLFVEFTGDTVRRGQAVAQIYSPELYSSQQEYLLALANRERMRSAGFDDARSAAGDLVESSRRKLQLLGMTDRQIDALAKAGQPFFTTTIHSSVGGVVVNKAVVPQQYVQAGQALLEVADLSRVWIEADVYEKDLGRIRVGQSAAIISSAFPDRVFQGKVAFVEPLVSGETRSNRVRIELPNEGMRLKPGMFVSVEFEGSGERGSALMVPATAVVDRGSEQFVWVESGPGAYEPRRVTIGGRQGDEIGILNGLREGERVVAQGSFLLDSEAQLRQMTAGPAEAGQRGSGDDSHRH